MKFTKKRQKLFISKLLETANVSLSASTCGISRKHVYRFKNMRDDSGELLNKEFSDAWDEAVEIAIDSLVEEAWRRATGGVEKPVGWYQGNPGGTVKEYSDNLLMFLIKAHRPQYREKIEGGQLIGDVVIIKQEPGYVGSTKTIVPKRNIK